MAIIHKLQQCQFGCGLRTYYEIIEFSDGLKLRIPRQDDNSIHDCPNLPSGNPLEDDSFQFAPELSPEDGELFDEFIEQHGEPVWLQEELTEHFIDMESSYGGWSGLEFKNTRDKFKKNLMEDLRQVPHFYLEMSLEDNEEPPPEEPYLPPCLDLSDWHDGPKDSPECIYPLEVLGLFYLMDGKLVDAKTCFEIQEELGVSVLNIRRNIKAIEDDMKELQEGSKKSQVIQQLPRPESEIESEQEKVWREIRKFENKHLKEYILTEIPKEELTKKLKSITLYFRQLTRDERKKIGEIYEKDGINADYVQNALKNEWITKKDLNAFDKEKKRYVPFSLFDKIKKYHAKDEKRQQVRKNPIDWDYLSLGDKINVLKKYIENKEIIECLIKINNHRDELAHSGEVSEYFSNSLELGNQETRLCIEKCKSYFETLGLK